MQKLLQKRIWIKRVFALLLVSLLVYQIKTHGDIDLWWSTFLTNWKSGQNRQWLVLALLLMPINWLLEIAKWRLLMRHSWLASWKKVAKAVFAGISLSIVTPNRIGEYGGRAILVPINQVATVVMTTFIGNVFQWLAFICCGWPALIYLLAIREDWSNSMLIVTAVFLPLILMFAVYWSRSIFKWVLRQKIGQQQKWIRWIRFKFWSIKRIKKNDLLMAFFLALFRLWVYSFQYLLLLWFFNISLTFFIGVTGIFSIYLIQAGIPLPPGLGVITRSELAIWIWGSQAVSPIGILSATFSLFLVNLMIPALLGSWLIVKRKNTNPK